MRKKDSNKIDKIDKFSKKLDSQRSKLNKHKSIMKIHYDKIEEFSETGKNKSIKNLNDKIKNSENEINKLKKEEALKKINENYTKSEYKLQISKLNDKIDEIKKEKRFIESNDKENEYMLNTLHLISNFSILEDEEEAIIKKNGSEDLLIQISIKKNEIKDEYMKFIDPDYVGTVQKHHSHCLVCGSKSLSNHEGALSCENCGMTFQTVHLADELGYKESQERDFRTQFTYKKETHLDDWIRRFESKENKEIPQEVLDKVIIEAHKERTKLMNLTEKQVKKYLKKLELNDYYDNVITIINRINKRPPFILTQEIKQKIRTMFQQIQAPFEKYKNPGRSNMLSYSFILHHFMKILDLPEFAEYFFLLKNAEKLRAQDETFKKIVQELALTDPTTNWRFTPSFA